MPCLSQWKSQWYVHVHSKLAIFDLLVESLHGLSDVQPENQTVFHINNYALGGIYKVSFTLFSATT